VSQVDAAGDIAGLAGEIRMRMAWQPLLEKCYSRALAASWPHVGVNNHLFGSGPRWPMSHGRQ